MRIFQRILSIAGQQLPLELWALSPSQHENNLARRRISTLLPAMAEPEIRVPDTNPNHTSVAAAVCVGQNHVLLGADLEETGDSRQGWSAVVASTNRPTMLADAFKIPHHGSATAHHAPTWSSLVTTSPTTAVTPWNWGRHSLPTDGDAQRIVSLSGQAFISCVQPVRRPRRRLNSVQKLLPKSLRQLPMIPGHIQLRKSLVGSGHPWNVALFDGAARLDEYKAP
jgi:hypothetical protein